MSMVGSAMEGVAAIGEGQSARAQAVARKDELGREAQLQTIAASESQGNRIMDLNRTLGNVQAFIGNRGLNPDSPSAMAIESGVQRVAGQDMQRTAFNARQQASSLNLAGRAAAMAGEAAANAGYLKGIGSFFKAAGSMGMGGGGGGGGGSGDS